MENTIKILDMTGKEAGEYTFDASLLETEKGEQAVKDTVVAFLASLRSGNACTKSRGMVRGGGAKPWRQKGTGRARAGSSRNPIWRGGGVVFGPQANRNYTKKVNKKVRRLALARAFTDKLAEGNVIIVEDTKIDAAKTKAALSFLEAIGAGDDALLLVDAVENSVENICLGTDNLSRIDVLPAELVNVYQLLVFKKIVITKSALVSIEKRLKGEKIYE